LLGWADEAPVEIVEKDVLRENLTVVGFEVGLKSRDA
jgi:hypothetical protein